MKGAEVDLDLPLHDRPGLRHLQERNDGIRRAPLEGPVERRTGLSCSPYLFGGRLRGFEMWSLPFTPDHQMLKDAHFIGHFIR
ncbi:hypothetical protein WME99_04760 [Sorangium sp. So ce136]|uniref:hypothetical protein n=1 Tax=Sorangium sp. So ce136 TaxID=3133284 RepID=UPI003EFD4A52